MISRSLKRAFSVPSYISLPAAGVDVSDRSIKFVELKRTSRGTRVRHHGHIPLVSGVVGGGQIKNSKTLVEELLKIKEQMNTSFVNVSLPEEQAYLFSTNIPKMKAEDIRDSLSLQMERFVPISLDEAIFDFNVVSVGKNSLEVQVVVIDKKTVDSYMSVFSDAGFQVVLFEIESQSVARSILPKDHKSTAMIVDLGDTRTGLSVVENGHVLFTTVSDITGSSYEKVFQDTLKVDQAEANRLKAKHGILEHVDTEKAKNSLLEITNSLSKDIQKTVQYWQSKHSRKSKGSGGFISNIYVCGGNANMPGLLSLLRDSSSVLVKNGDPWGRISGEGNQYVPAIEPEDSLGYCSALGLAIAGVAIYD